MKSISTIALAVYAGIMTFALAWLLLVTNHYQTFETIDVHRINIRESDGTIRLVCAGLARSPGPRPSATPSHGIW
jgi:hypothetical protein